MRKTHVAFCLDESGSVAGIIRPLIKSYNQSLADIKAAILREGQEATITALAFGHRQEGHRILYEGHQFQTIGELRDGDLQPSGMTPLFDSVARAIQCLEKLDDRDPSTAFIVNVVTDGEENDSRQFGPKAVCEMMRKCINTDRWTFTFMVPTGTKQRFCHNWSIPEGNVMEWDAYTSIGVQQGFVAASTAFDGYFKSRSMGVTSTRSFYANIDDVQSDEVEAVTKNITKDATVLIASTPDTIESFCRKSVGKFQKGAAFYQLTKTEREVQDYKKIIIRDKKSNEVFAGNVGVRKLLGLPTTGTITLKPGKHGQYDIYIQSTSTNRKLVPGASVIYWEDAI